MWLLPLFSPLANLVLRIFYRFRMAGERVPPEGPVLLVANHPNSLLDPASVVAVARRPVRFLAKAPLFTDAKVGWLIRAAGAIPVYRQQDDPSVTAQNEDTFRAVWRELAEGAAVGIFPEGVSHSEPSLVPLKTGAARIALGAAQRTGRAFPIVPVGLSFREKERFRSDALAVVGEAVEWDDLAHAGPEDRQVVRELTRRIDGALHGVTLNLERWEDAPLVRAAEAVYAAELTVDRGHDAQVERLREAAEGLARVRAEGRGEWRAVEREVAAHARILHVLGMTPAELKRRARVDVALSWTLRQIAFFALGAPVAVLGMAIYFIPYHFTGFAAELARTERDIRGTFKLLVGGLVHIAWTLAIAGVVAWRFGWLAALLTALALPLAGFVALHVVERWARATGQARRFLLRARRRESLDELRVRQHELALRLHALWEQVHEPQP